MNAKQVAFELMDSATGSGTVAVRNCEGVVTAFNEFVYSAINFAAFFGIESVREHTGNTATGNGNWAAADCFDIVDRQHELSLSRSRLECSTGDRSLRFISIFSLSPFLSFLLRQSNLTQAGSSSFFSF